MTGFSCSTAANFLVLTEMDFVQPRYFLMQWEIFKHICMSHEKLSKLYKSFTFCPYIASCYAPEQCLLVVHEWITLKLYDWDSNTTI